MKAWGLSANKRVEGIYLLQCLYYKRCICN